MKDRFYMVLALLGFILICFIFVQNYDVKQEAKTFEIGAYYTPTISNRQQSAYEIYQQIAGSRAIQCPETGLNAYNGEVFRIGTMFNSANPNRYNVEFFFFPMGISNSEGGYTQLSSSSEIYYRTVTQLGNRYDQAQAITADQMYSVALPTEPWAIISPFSFSFSNSNTDNVEGDGETIVIINDKGNCRITFTNAANWFCAGSVGTSMTKGSNTDNNTVEWEDHKGNHQTIVGASGNASIHRGGAGSVIGYASSQTSVFIEALVGTEWTPISVKDFIENTRD